MGFILLTTTLYHRVCVTLCYLKKEELRRSFGLILSEIIIIFFQVMPAFGPHAFLQITAEATSRSKKNRLTLTMIYEVFSWFLKIKLAIICVYVCVFHF